ncbi:MAG: hypothetical protein EHM52_00305 [Actinomycetota bacterium]|nr:MAG: hypothetical protein EHM52_00305 [Actinomycetota bacterium]
MTPSGENDHPDVNLKLDLKAFEVVAYTGEFKVVGTAHFGIGQRASSRRASDYIRAFSDTKMTLADVRIYSRDRLEIIDTAPFVVLNLEKVDLIYARDEDESRGAAAAPPEV